MTAPLHERLLRRADTLIEMGYGGCDTELREAAAALRPPEGEVGALIASLEETDREIEAGDTDVNFWPGERIRAALAHLRRLAALPKCGGRG